MKCVLVVPQLVDKWFKYEHSARELPGVQYLVAACEDQDIECCFINAYAKRLEHHTVCREIMKEDHKVIGISCTSQRHYPFVKEFIDILRSEFNYKGIICMGGFYASLAYIEILRDIPYLDFILRGEGEITFPDFVKFIYLNKEVIGIPGITYLENGQIFTKEPERITDLDCLPIPKRDMDIFDGVDPDKIFFRVIAGRGCYGQCSFCSVIMQTRPHYKVYRSAKNVVDEIEYIINNFGVRKFIFSDEIFHDSSNKGKQWVKDFAIIVKEQNIQLEFAIQMRASDIFEEQITLLKGIGLTSVAIGYESGVQRVLDEMKKNTTVEQNEIAASVIKKVGVTPVVAFIPIVPTMTFDELKENYKFIERIGNYTDYNLYNKLNIYNGCEYENILKNKGLLMERKNFYDRDNYIYIDQKVGFFSEVIEILKDNIANMRLKMYQMKQLNQENDEYNLLKDQYNDWLRINTKEFIDYCICSIDRNVFDYEVYRKRIIEDMKQIENWIRQYSEEKHIVSLF